MRAAERIVMAERIKQLREERGLTRQQMADALNLSLTAIAGYEQGYRVPRLEYLQDIAKFFKVSIDYIIGTTEEKGSEVTVNAVKINDSLIGDFLVKLNKILKESSMTSHEKQETLDMLLGILETMIAKKRYP